MAANTGAVISAMIDCNYGCPELIYHALNVYAFAKGIGEQEAIGPERLEILETAAVLHDIGIRRSEEKYHSFSGKYQQVEGPPIARSILEKLGFPSEAVERVCYLIAHHHEYSQIDGIDYQILVEADFLVNIYQENTPRENIEAVRRDVFRTKTGKRFLDDMFLREPPAPSLFAADLRRIAEQKWREEI